MSSASSHSSPVTQESAEKSSTRSTRQFGRDVLRTIEKVGNALPDPFLLFVILALAVMVMSAIGHAFGGSVTHPGTGEDVHIRSLLSGEGIEYILTSMLENFTGFAPLGLVLAVMLGIGLTEQVGYIQHAVQKTVRRVPFAALPYAAVFIGVIGNLASDAAMVVIPPLIGIVFHHAGRNPIAGVAAGFAGAGIGFTANLFVAGTDALLAGITTEAARIVDPEAHVTAVANWYFNVVCVFALTLVGGLVTTYVTEKRLGKYEGSINAEELEEETKESDRALLFSSVLGTAYIVLIAVVVLLPDSPLRGENGAIIDSPFMSGIIPIILGFFMLLGTSYGILMGKIKDSKDLSSYMAEGISGMSGYIVMVFAIAQFIKYFEWSNIGIWLAVNGSDFLKEIGFTGIFLIIGYIVFTALLNLIIPSGSAKWALEAPVFVPLFMQLGYHPGFIQAAYRMGDSSANMVTPVSPYLPIVLGYIRRYDKSAGVGTYVSIMLPYTIAFFCTFLAVFLVFFALEIPYGPGVTAHL
ncbi:transporter [Corynebacterium sp. HMSC035E02]|uniref:AbgT family transporter n=1 Tax=Corynebacterium sp. HMSC035E02 TaxID=1715114 RepID=UPI0008A95E89|nr:AbgT family transporter [Corynebacterium sp. HMSC035E02]OHO54131.1 transporter [Corynebacterium sp. HMSC035E02]